MNIGRTRLAIGPLTGLQELELTLERIELVPGISAVRVESFAGRRALLTLHLPQPLELDRELRAALGDRVLSCGVEADRLVVALRDPEDDAPDPVADGQVVEGTVVEEVVLDGSVVDGSAEEEPASPWAPGLPVAVVDGRPAPVAALAAGPPVRPAAGRPGTAPSAAVAVDGPPTGADARPLRPGPTADATALVLAAVEALPDVSIVVFGRDRRVRAAAGASVARSCAGGEDLVGCFADVLHPPAVRCLLAPGYEAALRGETTTIAFEDPTPPGACETTFSPIREGGAVVGGTAVTRELGARRAAEVAELVALLDGSFAHGPVASALISTDGRWLRVNRRLCELLGREAEDVVGSTLQDLTHPEDVGVDFELGRETLAGTRDRYAVEKRFVRADGRVVPTRQEVALVRGTGGGPSWFVVQVVELAAAAPQGGRLGAAAA